MSNVDPRDTTDDVPATPLRDGDSSIETDPALDAAQAEWDQTASLHTDANADAATATGDDPAQIPADDDDIPTEDLPSASEQPETQGASPEVAYLGDDGQGELSPGDL